LPGGGKRPLLDGVKILRLPVALGVVAAAAVAAADATAPADWTVHGQATVIEQWHYAFPSPYVGPNSFLPSEDAEHTLSSTLFLGRRLWAGAGLFYNPEFLQGGGLSQTVGIASFPNGEAAKASFNNLHYNTSRLYLQQVVALGGETEAVDDDQNQLAGRRAADRLTFTLGKFSAADFFDDNAASHDARTQFMNIALGESAAWDFPADALGYTGGFVAEWARPRWTWRYGFLMEPTVANGPSLEADVGRARGQILEADRGYTWGGRPGVLRAFVFWNRADMGSYAATLATPADRQDIALTRADRSKVGAGVSWDQALTGDLTAFSRLSWNDGRTESWAFTEIDRSLAAGLSLKGSGWGRADDTAAVAAVASGLSTGHRDYLEAGGTGLILGDGALTYAPEEITEIYYSARVCRWLWVTPDYQYVEHPGYNSARGGVAIYALRAHVEF
jgi:high affinity Mn2+ porin